MVGKEVESVAVEGGLRAAGGRAAVGMAVGANAAVGVGVRVAVGMAHSDSTERRELMQGAEDV